MFYFARNCKRPYCSHFIFYHLIKDADLRRPRCRGSYLRKPILLNLKSPDTGLFDYESMIVRPKHQIMTVNSTRCKNYTAAQAERLWQNFLERLFPRSQALQQNEMKMFNQTVVQAGQPTLK